MSFRPTIMGTRHMIASGHYHASIAGFEILEAGGNAVDAGVCAGMVLAVVESTYVSLAGVAPIAIYLADERRVMTISGLGGWPKAASCDLFVQRHGGVIPRGILRTVVPAAPDAWITALQKFGTMAFCDVAEAAIRFAQHGFPMYPFMAATIAGSAREIGEWPSNAAIYLPGGAPPQLGLPFVQTALAGTLRHMCDEERANARLGREGALDAVRDCFYKGDIARAILDFHGANGGLLAATDLSEFHVAIEPAVRRRFHDVDVYSCGAWCQGPMLLQQLAILEHVDLRALGHNTPGYVHMVTEAIKLAAADREAYYGDPRFVDVPLDRLLSPAYATERLRLIDVHHAFSDLPPAANPSGRTAENTANEGRAGERQPVNLDTSYVCVVDRFGNAFSATPSDPVTSAPVVPQTGFVVSPRGGQSWTDRKHPSSVMPGKRPRLTPNPAIAIHQGKFIMPFGTPGHDSQTQVMLQTLLNIVMFDMELQDAVEAARFCSLSFPSSASPHHSHPGRLLLETPIFRDAGEALENLGHRVEEWPATGPEYYQNASASCAVQLDLATGVLKGGADHRRPAYVVGW
ncbi:MAG: gamma-glutamyltransferase family protein [Alphaproteobacteria bacterium]|nr:gamma-glutamyltransferase family protein [Alphaproteobacteria bacterium]